MPPLDRYLETRRGFSPARRTVLPTRYTHIVHAYQAVQPWSADQSRLLYIGFDRPDHACDIVVRDLASGKEQALASTRSFDFHTGASQRWVMNDTAVLFRDAGPDGKMLRRLARADKPGTAETIDELTGWDTRCVINGGRTIICSLRGHEGTLSTVSSFDLAERRHRVLFDAEAVRKGITRGEQPRAQDIGFQHTVATDEGRRIFFKLDLPNPSGAAMPLERSFHVFDTQSGEFTDFGGDVLGHPAWADGRHVLNIEKTRDGVDNRWLVAMNAETGEVERLTTLAIEGAGHPCISPDGKWLVTDSFTADGTRSRIYLLAFHDGMLRELDCLDHRSKAQPGFYDPYVITRAHPHPVWSPDGRSIAGNCNFGGTHIGIVIWDELGIE